MSEIKIESLSKSIKGTLILDKVSLVLNSGNIYGLRGKNGSGKTMLMRAMSGLLIPDTGSVIINGKTLHKDISFPESIGILIENPSFLPQYTGFKNLKLLAGLTGNISDDEIRTALERVGLDPEDKRIYRKYSLGMKQKLGIANAIMGEPDIIILDEPINALDEESVKKIKKVLLEIRDKDKLIVIACHDREELEYLSDIIYEIKDGSIVDRKEISNDNTKTFEA
jgi:ABC-2 type transport system ATP-binding protein